MVAFCAKTNGTIPSEAICRLVELNLKVKWQ